MLATIQKQICYHTTIHSPGCPHKTGLNKPERDTLPETNVAAGDLKKY